MLLFSLPFFSLSGIKLQPEGWSNLPTFAPFLIMTHEDNTTFNAVPRFDKKFLEDLLHCFCADISTIMRTFKRYFRNQPISTLYCFF